MIAQTIENDLSCNKPAVTSLSILDSLQFFTLALSCFGCDITLWLCYSFVTSVCVILWGTLTFLCLTHWVALTGLCKSSVRKASSESSQARLKSKATSESKRPRITQILRLHLRKNKYAYCCQNMSLSSYWNKITCQNKTSSIIWCNGKKNTDTVICQRLFIYLFQAAVHCHFQAHVGQKTTHPLTRESL